MEHGLYLEGYDIAKPLKTTRNWAIRVDDENFPSTNEEIDRTMRMGDELRYTSYSRGKLINSIVLNPGEWMSPMSARFAMWL